MIVCCTMHFARLPTGLGLLTDKMLPSSELIWKCQWLIRPTPKNTFRRLNMNIAENYHFEGTLTLLSSASANDRYRNRKWRWRSVTRTDITTSANKATISSTPASAPPVQLAAVDSRILLKVSLDERYLRLRKLVSSCFNEWGPSRSVGAHSNSSG